MGILPIGFFSPLPLAMMIPFMATQSLAMGEAFGKSFQYGKRKISSMSNEEFNKLTFHDLMVEQTANIKAIVPELSKQMAQSQTMQAAIFKEMVNLIPTFFDSLFSALDPKHIENPSLISQATQQPPPTQIRYYNDRQGIPDESQQLKELKALLESSLEQQGTKQDYLDKLKAQNTPPPTSYDSGLTPYTLLRDTTVPSRVTIKIWAGTPNSTTYNGYGQVNKYLTTLIRKINRASRVLSLTKIGAANRNDKIPYATKITYWSALITGNKALQNDEVIYFSIPPGY